MAFPPLLGARLVARPNRFLVVADLDGRRVRVACRDPGRLSGVLRAGSELRIAEAWRPGRATRYTLFLARHRRRWVCLVPDVASRVLEAALARGELPGFRRARLVRREVVVGRSRLDFQLRTPWGPLFVEVKAVGLVKGRRGLFPDAPTARGLRHVRELIGLRDRGERAAVAFVALRSDVERVSPHAGIDPALAAALGDARRAGVLVTAFACRVTPAGCRLERRIPFETGW